MVLYDMVLVLGSIFLTYGGYGRVTFAADPSVIPNEETAKRLADEFWNEIDRLSEITSKDFQQGDKLRVNDDSVC
jgi:hypothetical protein